MSALPPSISAGAPLPPAASPFVPAGITAASAPSTSTASADALDRGRALFGSPAGGDSRPDASFASVTLAGGDAEGAICEASPAGGLFLWGDFHGVSGVPLTNLARLNPDGTPDGSFVAELPLDVRGIPVRVADLAPLSDGGVLLVTRGAAAETLMEVLSLSHAQFEEPRNLMLMRMCGLSMDHVSCNRAGSTTRPESSNHVSYAHDC